MTAVDRMNRLVTVSSVRVKYLRIITPARDVRNRDVLPVTGDEHVSDSALAVCRRALPALVV